MDCFCWVIICHEQKHWGFDLYTEKNLSYTLTVVNLILEKVIDYVDYCFDYDA